jgi:glycosyltransferase 2 family protein
MDDLPVDLGAMGARFASVDARLVAVAVLLQLVNLALRSRAWQHVLRASYPGADVSLARVGCAYVAGMALNGIVPARGGDAAKAVLARLAIAGSAVATIGGTLLVAGHGVRVPSHALPLAALLAVVVAALLLVARRHRARAAALRARLAQGGAILRTPRRYARSVALLQALAWATRLGVVLALLRAFGIHAGLAQALLVLVVGGIASAVPAPGGGGAQQVAAVYLLAGQATAAQALSFSLGMQAGITLLNLALGCAAAMALFRTVRPRAAVAAFVAAREA